MLVLFSLFVVVATTCLYNAAVNENRTISPGPKRVKGLNLASLVNLPNAPGKCVDDEAPAFQGCMKANAE